MVAKNNAFGLKKEILTFKANDEIPQHFKSKQIAPSMNFLVFTIVSKTWEQWRSVISQGGRQLKFPSTGHLIAA